MTGGATVVAFEDLDGWEQIEVTKAMLYNMSQSRIALVGIQYLTRQYLPPDRVTFCFYFRDGEVFSVSTLRQQQKKIQVENVSSSKDSGH